MAKTPRVCCFNAPHARKHGMAFGPLKPYQVPLAVWNWRGHLHGCRYWAHCAHRPSQGAYHASFLLLCVYNHANVSQEHMANLSNWSVGPTFRAYLPNADLYVSIRSDYEWRFGRYSRVWPSRQGTNGGDHLGATTLGTSHRRSFFLSYSRRASS